MFHNNFQGRTNVSWPILDKLLIGIIDNICNFLLTLILHWWRIKRARARHTKLFFTSFLNFEKRLHGESIQDLGSLDSFSHWLPASQHDWKHFTNTRRNISYCCCQWENVRKYNFTLSSLLIFYAKIPRKNQCWTVDWNVQTQHKLFAGLWRNLLFFLINISCRKFWIFSNKIELENWKETTIKLDQFILLHKVISKKKEWKGIISQNSKRFLNS